MVSNYDIIKKYPDLVEDDYKQIYNNLVIDDVVIIPYDKRHLDKVIRRLRYPSKSVRGMFNYCPRQFQFKRILDVGYYTEDDEYDTFFSVYGRNTHMVFDKVWNKITYKSLVRLKSRDLIRKYIFIKCMGFVPEIEKGTKIEKQYEILFYNYADYESFRICYVFDNIGYTNVKKYVLPMFRELRVENHNSYETGTVDIVHRLINDEVAIGDYKTGKPKYYRWDDNPRIKSSKLEFAKTEYTNYDKQAVDFELGSYYNLLLDITEIYKVVTIGNRNSLIPLKFLNPKWGFVLYLRDWKNTFKYIKLKPDMIASVRVITDKMIEAINDGLFPLNISGRCFDYCNCVDVCIKDSLWKSKFTSMEPFYKKKLDNIFLEVKFKNS